MRAQYCEKKYSGENLNHIAFPLGGIGAGMFCIEGGGALSNFSTRNYPDVFCEPNLFSAISVRQGSSWTARVLEGQVPWRKIFGQKGTGNGGQGSSYGLPRFRCAEFSSRFPFASIKLVDRTFPIDAAISAWSPFIPLDADNSSLPVAAIEFSFVNKSPTDISAVYSFNARNFLSERYGKARVDGLENGFILRQDGEDDACWKQSSFCVRTNARAAEVDLAWFRGGWFDCLTMLWEKISSGGHSASSAPASGEASPGASIFVPLRIGRGRTVSLTIFFSWYTPYSNIRVPAPRKDRWGRYLPGEEVDFRKQFHRPWYTAKFKDVESVSDYWMRDYPGLKAESRKFSDCFFDSDLPREILEAVAANLSILKSPSILRQRDGRLWAWEGCCDNCGCCPGSCTHVWNYAQALAHLFPGLERTIRETEFNECQGKSGHQNFRAWLPIRKTDNEPVLAAADGQLGGILKLYRDWKISGDTKWLASIWTKARRSLDYCIRTWDPDKTGVLVEPHHNTYDIEFWGTDGMCSSIYLGALKAAIGICTALDEDSSEYSSLLEKGRKHLEGKLFNGEYFEQEVRWGDLRAPHPSKFNSLVENAYSSEALELLEKEGPKYQYGPGCLSDGVIGEWLAMVCGAGSIMDPKKVATHLLSVYKYNFKETLVSHANPQRPTYAAGDETGLLLCTWPRGGKPSLPFPYCDEVWTGVEYQVASHLISCGKISQGLRIVKGIRDRYDGAKRNPFNEYECGHWYVRALASYSLIQSCSGARYDATEKTLYMRPAMKGDFKSFICTSTGYGLTGVKNGRPFIRTVSGKIKVSRIVHG